MGTTGAAETPHTLLLDGAPFGALSIGATAGIYGSGTAQRAFATAVLGVKLVAWRSHAAGRLLGTIPEGTGHKMNDRLVQ